MVYALIVNVDQSHSYALPRGLMLYFPFSSVAKAEPRPLSMLSQCPKLHPGHVSIANADQSYGLAPNVLSQVKLHLHERGLD